MSEVISKREQNRLHRREAIIAVATQSFLELGYAGTSMSTIAAELGGSKGTLWAHFSSKEELFTAVIDEMIAADAVAIDQVLTQSRYTRPSLREFCMLFISKLMKPESVKLFRMVIAEGERFPVLADSLAERGPIRMMNHLTDYLGTAMPLDQAKVMARIILVSIVGYRTNVLMFDRRFDYETPEEFINALLDHLPLPDQA